MSDQILGKYMYHNDIIEFKNEKILGKLLECENLLDQIYLVNNKQPPSNKKIEIDKVDIIDNLLNENEKNNLALQRQKSHNINCDPRGRGILPTRMMNQPN